MLQQLIATLCAGLVASMALAQDPQGPARGPETNLPLPRYVSMRAEEANVRRGPSTGHRIDWVFTQRHTPLRVLAEYGHWRKVVDRDDQGGWIHFALLSGTRYVVIETDTTLLRRPDPASDDIARVEPGVLGRLLECTPDWCRVRVEHSLPCQSSLCLRDSVSYRGWLPKDSVWGVDPEEVFD